MKAKSSSLLIGFTFFTCCIFAPAGPAESPWATDPLILANSSFAFRLLNEVAKEQPHKNIFISPSSVSTVLQMVGSGANGKTKTELDAALGIAGISRPILNEGNRQLNRQLHADSTNLVLNTANAIWYRTGIPIKPEFIAANKEFYQATIKGVDFDNPAAANAINSWVKEKTHGKITDMVSPPIDPRTDLYLANAVYFKGLWMLPFDAKDTKARAFHLSEGKLKDVPMMFKSGDFSYRRGPNYQAVRLPYKGRNLAMYVFLPDSGTSPEEISAPMDGVAWERAIPPDFGGQPGTLALPRFKLEYSVDLIPPLEVAGIHEAFLPTADFSAMCGNPVFISAAKQKTFVEVNEKGTEAAAVTGLTVLAGVRVEPPKPFEMIVERPFLFVIEDHSSNTILFMGVIQDPSVAN